LRAHCSCVCRTCRALAVEYVSVYFCRSLKVIETNVSSLPDSMDWEREKGELGTIFHVFRHGRDWTSQCLCAENGIGVKRHWKWDDRSRFEITWWYRQRNCPVYKLVSRDEHRVDSLCRQQRKQIDSSKNIFASLPRLQFDA
jgi:hypothetical protein